MVRPDRGGFSLVEVLISLVLFAGGVLSIAAAASRAASMVRTAEASEGARAVLVSVVDSLTQYASPASGKAVRGRYRVDWTVADSGAVAAVRARIFWHDGTRARSDSVAAFAGSVPARLHVLP